MAFETTGSVSVEINTNDTAVFYEPRDVSHIMCLIFKQFGNNRISTNNYKDINSTLPSARLLSTKMKNPKVPT